MTVASVVGIAGLGCAMPETNAESTESELITFPASAYAKATPISYGKSATVAFATADEFVAVKFVGTTGDRVTFDVSASRPQMAEVDAVAYLVFNGKNVNALRDKDTPTRFSFTLTSTGEHFIMMRTRDRRPADVKVSLDVGGSAGNGVSYAKLVAATQPGSAPQVPLQHDILSVGRRNCVAATGCGETAPGEQVDIFVSLDAPPSGGVTGIFTVQGEERHFDASVSGVDRWKIDIEVSDGPTRAPRPFEVVATHDGSRVELEVRSEVERSGTNWSELWGTTTAYVPDFVSVESVRQAVATPPPPGDIVTSAPLSDEEVISRFPAGAQERGVHESHLGIQVGMAGSRACGPRTGCSRWIAEDADQRPEGQGVRSLEFMLGPSSSALLRITGVDSYAVVLRTGSSELAVIPIENGKGSLKTTHRTYDVLVTNEGIVFRSPLERRNGPDVKSFKTPQGKDVPEAGYTYESYVFPSIRLNANWW
ncbi:MAG TPA: hypothetical protein VM925_02410 [Labilithrix sp.]|nr:hypothetical protein [Labilithrix sp.]